MSRPRLPLRPELADLAPYHTSHAARGVKLDANESPWPLPDDARRELAEALAAVDWHRYPDGRATALREAVAARTGAHPDELVLGVGSDEVIALLASALRRPAFGRARAAVVVPTPTFVMYALTARAQGLEPVAVPLDRPDFTLDGDAVVAAARASGASLVFLATPNNPTGGVFPEATLRHIAERLPETLVVLDEAYAAFAGRDLRHVFGALPNVALLGTLSKLGLAAARVGWARLPAALAVEVEKVRQPYSLSTPAQVVATLALGRLAPVLDAQVAAVVAARAALAAALATHPAVRRVHGSHANFLLVEVDDAAQTRETLRARGVLVRHFPGEPALAAHHLRITVGTPAENARLLEALDGA